MVTPILPQSSPTSDQLRRESGAGVEGEPTDPTSALTSPYDAAPAIEQETVFTVLAERASIRSARDLTLTALAGAANAVFVLQYFGVVWLASAFATVSAYGIWGLANAALRDRLELADDEPAGGGVALTLFLRLGRAVAATAGVVAALATAAGFMLAAFPNWGMSG